MKKKDFIYLVIFSIFGILVLYLSPRINNSICIFILNLFFVIIFIVCCMLIFILAFELVTKEPKNSKKPVINFYTVFTEFSRTKIFTKVSLYSFFYFIVSIIL